MSTAAMPALAVLNAIAEIGTITDRRCPTTKRPDLTMTYWGIPDRNSIIKSLTVPIFSPSTFSTFIPWKSQKWLYADQTSSRVGRVGFSTSADCSVPAAIHPPGASRKVTLIVPATSAVPTILMLQYHRCGLTGQWGLQPVNCNRYETVELP